MIKRLFVFAAVAFATASLGYGLYMEIKIQNWNSTVTELHQLEAEHGKCTKTKDYGRSAWSCPTEEMVQLRDDLRYMEWGISNAEETRNLSYAMTLIGPLMIAIIGSVVIGYVIPLAAAGLQVGRYGAHQISKVSASTSKRAITGASSMSNSFKGRTKECPSCAEMIKPKARVCIHCGRDV